MSVMTLPRYETLWSNDPAVITSFSYSGLTSPQSIKTVFQGVADPVLAFGRILFNSSNNPTSVIGSDVMPSATECALSWCVQTLNTSIQNGILDQTILRSWSNTSALDTSDVHLSPYTTNSNIPDYYVSPVSNVPLVRFLEDAFNASSVQGINLPGSGLSLEEQLDLTIYSSDIAQALWHADDLSSLMNNLADRMTDALRNLYSDPATDATAFGNVYTTQIYVHVTWPWLILPVGLVLASCMLLLAAIISSNRHQTIVWKSSILAVLFHGLESPGGDGGGGGSDSTDTGGRNKHSMYRKEMEMTAEDMKVRLAEKKDGDVRLVRVQRQRRDDTERSGKHVRRW